MRSMILSVSGKDTMNYLIKTVLSPKYNILLVNSVFDATTKIRAEKNINLLIVDVDHQPQESYDFINHISSSSIYRIPVIVLHTVNKDILEKNLEGNYYKSFQKPFNPIHLSDAVELTIAKKTVNIFLTN